MPVCDFDVPGPHEACQRISIEAVSRQGDTTSHHVVRDIGEMMCCSDAVAGSLLRVSQAHDLREGHGRFLHRRGEGGPEVRL